MPWWRYRHSWASNFRRAFIPSACMSSRTHTPSIVKYSHEARAAGVPIVATRVGGVPEVLPEGTALLVPAESPVEVARAIRATIADPSASTRRAAAARQRLETTYGLTSWTSMYEDIYQRAR